MSAQCCLSVCACVCVCVCMRACLSVPPICIFLTSLELGMWNVVQVWVININPDSLRNTHPWKLKSLYQFYTLHISNKQDAALLPLWWNPLSNFRNQKREIQNSVNSYLICIHKTILFRNMLYNRLYNTLYVQRYNHKFNLTEE